MRLFCCALVLGVVAAAQPVIRVTTRLVDISVIARDSKGPVADLRQDDFRVFDNGVERPVAFFSIQSTRPPASLTSAGSAQLPGAITNRPEARADAPSRLTVFVIDQLNTEFEAQARVRKQILAYLPRLGLRDRAAIWVMSDRLRRIQDFTNDVHQLTAAVEGIKPSVWLVPHRTPNVAHRAPSSEGEALASKAAETADELQQYYRMHLTNDLMRDLGSALARIPGRKNVVWISGAFPITITIGPGGPETSYVRERLSGTGKALAVGNASLYPVDALGLVAAAGGVPAGRVFLAERDRHETLDVIAHATGGRAIYDTNDLAGAIGEAVDDAAVTYTIGFYPAEDRGEGEQHSVRIEMKRARGVELRYRSSYVASDLPASGAADDARDAIHNALTSPIEAPAVGITARLEAADPKRPDWARMTISVGQSDLTEGGSIDLIVAQYAPDGHELAAVHTEVPVKNAGLMRRQVQLSPSTSKIRIVVCDYRSGRVGSLDLAARTATK